MTVRNPVILAAAVLAVTMFGASNAGAWGYSRHGYGHHYGLHHFFGLGHRYGYGRQHGGYGRPYDYGRGSYGGRDHAAPAKPTANQSSDCRRLTKRIVIDGAEQTVSGTACPQDDGRWKFVE